MIIKMPTYEIKLFDNGIQNISKEIKKIYNGKRLYIITDKIIYNIYKSKFKDIFKDFKISIVINKNKSYKSYIQTINKLIDLNINKKDLLIAFGGGTIGDITGYIASTLYRGINYIQIPTTLLAQVDSSIGGKTGVDLKKGKNLIGSFYNPKLVIIDTYFLKTLPYDEYKNGYAEAIKMALTMDKDYYQEIKKINFLSIDQIKKAINLKKEVVLIDPYDKKERQILNFGHTYGHAIEKVGKYRKYKHGEAISYGMLMALETGIEKDITPPYIYEDLKNVLMEKKLIKEPLLKKEKYKKHLKYDKKKTEKGINFILVDKIGSSVIKTFKEHEL